VADPDTRRLAEVAAVIHATDPAGFRHDYFPWYADVTVSAPPVRSCTRTGRCPRLARAVGAQVPLPLEPNIRRL
jgi:hypothetical protein